MAKNTQRTYKRVSISLDVRWQSATGKFTAKCADISPDGCYIASTAPVQEGKRISIDVQLPTGRWLPLRGEVVKHQPNAGFGVRFLELPESSQKMLTHLIEYAREDEAESP
jgi:c-di-GMP-binding flagellar brake protein YcgR